MSSINESLLRVTVHKTIVVYVNGFLFINGSNNIGSKAFVFITDYSLRDPVFFVERLSIEY